MCILRKILFYCPDCRSTSDPTRNGIKRIITSESSTNRMILCPKYENDKRFRHEKRRERQEAAVRAERDRLEAADKAAKELAKERAEKNFDKAAAKKDKEGGEGVGEGGAKVTKLDKKQEKMRDDAERIAAGGSDDEAIVVAKPVKEKKARVGKSDASSGLMRKIERENRQIRDNAIRRLASGERVGRGPRTVKQGNHQVHGEVAKVERLCDAHIKLRAWGSKRREEGLRGEARMAEKWMVPGDLATAVRWREQGKKPKHRSVQSTLFFHDSSSDEDTDDWAANKENMDGRENYKKVEMGGRGVTHSQETEIENVESSSEGESDDDLIFQPRRVLRFA